MIYDLKEEHDFSHPLKGDLKKIKDGLSKMGYGSLYSDCLSLWREYSVTQGEDWVDIPKPLKLHKILREELKTQLNIE